MKLNLILNVLGHNIMLGVGFEIQKDDSDDDTEIEAEHTDLHSTVERVTVGFGPNKEPDYDETEDDEDE